ncbi:hypothetical protein D3C76_1269240 [compost metagenome]
MDQPDSPASQHHYRRSQHEHRRFDYAAIDPEQICVADDGGHDGFRQLRHYGGPAAVYIGGSARQNVHSLCLRPSRNLYIHGNSEPGEIQGHDLYPARRVNVRRNRQFGNYFFCV